MKLRLSLWFYIGAALLLLFNHADFLYQAAIWKWDSWIDLTYRAPHWPGILDAIPHDGWHVVQFIRNHAMLIGSPFVFYGTKHLYHGIWIEMAAIIAVYAVTRGLGFTLFLP